MLSRLSAIPNLQVFENVALARHTRFEIGGQALALVDASTESALMDALLVIRESGVRLAVIGGGSNLIVADEGFPGVVLRYTANSIELDGRSVRAEAGAVLQTLVDTTIGEDLQGLETMTGIPGWVGGAIYGNAGAYGHSIEERVESVRFFNGREVLEIGNTDCDFRYRESVFKRQTGWIILAATLRLDAANSAELRATADGILKIRNEKYPPTLRCAGSIFKNLMVAELPESARTQVPERVIREGKVPSAYFLEACGAKGMVKGGVKVADYHANLIFNAGGGTAKEVLEMIEELKHRVREKFDLELEEEVRYVGKD